MQLQEVITKKQTEAENLENQINKIVDRAFEKFSASVGVASIREYEENQLRGAQEMAERRLRLNNQISKLKNQYGRTTLIHEFVFILWQHCVSSEAFH